MDDFSDVASLLAEVFLRGKWSSDELLERGRKVTGRRFEKSLKSIVAAVISEFGANPPVPVQQVLARFLASHPRMERLQEVATKIHRALADLPPVQMQPAPSLAGPVFPQITTPGALGEWLGVTIRELDWFADVAGYQRRTSIEALRHYRYRTLAKRSGGLRLLQSPKPRLKQLQRQILHGILDHVPGHPASHAFRIGRSVVSYVTPHAGRAVILHVDLREFFPSIRASRVFSIFHTLGYPERVSRILTGLCTNRVPVTELMGLPASSSRDAYPWDTFARIRYRSPHLPQGAPTSPSLANLAAYRLDVRLSALAQRFGVTYTRYADDLLFSGGNEFVRAMSRFRNLTCAIVLDEGFAIRERKMRVLPQGGRQRVAGVVLNAHPNPPRREYDDLKALLFNCVRFGPASQNRNHHRQFREHLRGRIVWMSTINADRGKKLQALFDRIGW